MNKLIPSQNKNINKTLTALSHKFYKYKSFLINAFKPLQTTNSETDIQHLSFTIPINYKEES